LALRYSSSLSRRPSSMTPATPLRIPPIDQGGEVNGLRTEVQACSPEGLFMVRTPSIAGDCKNSDV
jgi:hypothetical protein